MISCILLMLEAASVLDCIGIECQTAKFVCSARKDGRFRLKSGANRVVIAASVLSSLEAAAHIRCHYLNGTSISFDTGEEAVAARIFLKFCVRFVI